MTTTIATRFQTSAAAVAIAAAATLIPTVAQAAPVSQYASEWSQSVESVFDAPLAPIICIGTVPQCASPSAGVLFSLDLAALTRLIPIVGPFIAAVITQFNLAGCVFGFCVQTGPYGTSI
jgi:hypothetical protein